MRQFLDNDANGDLMLPMHDSPRRLPGDVNPVERAPGSMNGMAMILMKSPMTVDDGCQHGWLRSGSPSAPLLHHALDFIHPAHRISTCQLVPINVL